MDYSGLKELALDDLEDVTRIVVNQLVPPHLSQRRQDANDFLLTEAWILARSLEEKHPGKGDLRGILHFQLKRRLTSWLQINGPVRRGGSMRHTRLASMKSLDAPLTDSDDSGALYDVLGAREEEESLPVEIEISQIVGTIWRVSVGTHEVRVRGHRNAKAASLMLSRYFSSDLPRLRDAAEGLFNFNTAASILKKLGLGRSSSVQRQIEHARQRGGLPQHTSLEAQRLRRLDRDMPVPEIASMLGISKPQVYKYLSRTTKNRRTRERTRTDKYISDEMKKGTTKAQIARDLGLSWSAVYNRTRVKS